jgi:hypothetical protein
MMPGARFFLFIIGPALYLARWEGRQSRLQSVTKGRLFSPSSPRPFYSWSSIFIQHQNIFGLWLRYWTRAEPVPERRT